MDIINADEIAAVLDQLLDLLMQCRSVFPTVRENMIGQREFQAPSFYQHLGYNAHIRLTEPITQEFIERNHRLARWINENAIIRLHGIMNYHGLVNPIDHSLPGWEEVDLMRRMRNAFTKTPLSYRPTDRNNVQTRDQVISHFRLEAHDREQQGIPVPIDAVIRPMFARCQEYIRAWAAKSDG